MSKFELPLRFLRTTEAARFLRLSPRTLEKHRCYGTRPAYRKVGGRVVYALPDLVSWPIEVFVPQRQTRRAWSFRPCPPTGRRSDLGLTALVGAVSLRGTLFRPLLPPRG